MINLQKIVACGLFAGLKNYLSGSVVLSIPAQTIPDLGVISYTKTITLNNDDAISNVRFNVGGYETFYRYLTGYQTVNLPIYNNPDIQIAVYSVYGFGDLDVHFDITNTSGAPYNLPATDITIKYRLFIAPF